VVVLLRHQINAEYFVTVKNSRHKKTRHIVRVVTLSSRTQGGKARGLDARLNCSTVRELLPDLKLHPSTVILLTLICGPAVTLGYITFMPITLMV
jgi:hypothetical protein